MINKILKESKKNKRVIGIGLYGDNGFWSGIVIDFNDEIVHFQHYTSYGKPDGIGLERISQIERIDFDDEYTNAMEHIIKNSDKLEEGKFKSRFYEDLTEENWQTQTLKPYEKEKNQLVSIQINQDSFYKGLIEKLDEQTLLFRVIDELGNDKGLSLFKIEDVSSIKINDLECRKRFLLYSLKKN
jgi:hypothetical protein